MGGAKMSRSEENEQEGYTGNSEILDFNLYLIGKITEEVTAVFVSDLFNIAESILGMFPEDGQRPPITITISTQGGDLTEMFAIYDAMKRVQAMNIEIETLGLGKVMSCGLVLLSAGSKGLRTAGKNTRFMYHSVNGAIVGTHQEMTQQKVELDYMQRQYIKVLSAETTKAVSFYERMMKKHIDYYFNSEEALKWGIIDAIEE